MDKHTTKTLNQLVGYSTIIEQSFGHSAKITGKVSRLDICGHRCVEFPCVFETTPSRLRIFEKSRFGDFDILIKNYKAPVGPYTGKILFEESAYLPLLGFAPVSVIHRLLSPVTAKVLYTEDPRYFNDTGLEDEKINKLFIGSSKCIRHMPGLVFSGGVDFYHPGFEPYELEDAIDRWNLFFPTQISKWKTYGN